MTRRRRVLHIVHSLNLGGAERLAAQLSMTLSDEFDITVACLDDTGLWAKEVRDAGVPVVELFRQPGLDAVVALRIAKMAWLGGVGLVHAHQYSPYFYAALARTIAPRTRTKLLFHEHGRHYPEVESNKRIAVNRHLFSRVTRRVVAVSADVRERLIRYEGLPPSLIEVVYNGTEVPPPPNSQERASMREELGLGRDDIVFGTVGRLDPVKNVPMAVRALSALRPGDQRLKLLVIGDGPAREEIVAAAEEQDVADAVIMTGFRSDAARLTGAMDVFLLPSMTEGTSLALVSAMGAGIPSVATAVGGTPEVLADKRTGLLIPSEGEHELIEAISSLLADRELAKSMGRAAREVYLERFTFDGMIGRFREIYREELS